MTFQNWTFLIVWKIWTTHERKIHHFMDPFEMVYKYIYRLWTFFDSLDEQFVDNEKKSNFNI